MLTLDSETEKNVKEWLDGPYDEATKQEIRRLQKEDPKTLTDAFYKKLEFGTGGLRGIMGVGSNRLNRYTIGQVTQGLANYLKTGSLLISYDSRHHSREFAEQTARVLAANNIKVYIYDQLHPVPMTSFGCRHLKCSAAIMITASHNPPEYNGYKVYWSDGCQVLPPHDTGIIEEVRKVTTFNLAPPDHPLIEWITDTLDLAYLETTHTLQSCPKQNRLSGKELRLIYTPLHGSGIVSVPPALANWGFTDVQLVEAQKGPDGDFPTVTTPNPEEHAALKLGIDQMLAQKADLIIGTDPDCDRVGIAIRHQEKAELIGGNQFACLCLDHLLKKNKLPPNPAVIKTIVTTELFRAIADKHNIPCFDTLTGFKYIGQQITKWEQNNTYTYLFGGEESYGYLLGTHARDKDAIISSCLISEVALDAKLEGQTLLDRMDQIYDEYGVYREKLHSLTFEGKAGADQMHTIMQALRTNPPRTLNNIPVKTIEDYQAGVEGFPKSNVLLYRLADETKVVIRPSGTEPKMKLYCAVKGTSIPECDKRLNDLLSQLTVQLSSS